MRNFEKTRGPFTFEGTSLLLLKTPQFLFLVHTRMTKLADRCAVVLARNTWAFQEILPHLRSVDMPADVLNDMVMEWSWRWLMHNHEFVTRYFPHSKQEEEARARVGLLSAIRQSCLTQAIRFCWPRRGPLHVTVMDDRTVFCWPERVPMDDDDDNCIVCECYLQR